MKVNEESEKVGLKLNIQKTKIMASSPITSWKIYGEIMETEADFIFRGSKITADGECSHEIKRCLPLGRKFMTPCQQSLSSQSYCFSSSHVWMWGLEYKESWAPRNWRFWTMVLEETIESPLGFREIQPVHPKGNESWIFIGRTDGKLKVQYAGHLMQITDLFEDSDAGKDQRWEEKGTAEVFVWHHRLHEHEFE